MHRDMDFHQRIVIELAAGLSVLTGFASVFPLIVSSIAALLACIWYGFNIYDRLKKGSKT